MAFVKEAYSAGRVNLIYQLLKSEADNGAPKDYDIKVDELKVISRTGDPERFFSHEEFVLPETKSIVINIYDNKSHRCTRYSLMLKEEQGKQELSGFEKSITDKIAQERKQWEFDLLKKENAELNEKLKEGEEYVEKIEKEIFDLREAQEKEKGNKKQKINDLLINLAGVYLASKPNALSGIPLLGELLGGNEANKETSKTEETETEPEGKCSFTMSDEKPKTFTGEITDEDTDNLGKALCPFYKPEYLGVIVHILNSLFKYNELILQTAKVIDHAISEGKQSDKAA